MPILSRFVALLTTVSVSVLTITPSASAGDLVAFSTPVSAGTIVVRTSERRLYLVLGEGRALRYVVGVGRARSQWAGASFIDGKYVRPNWAPPASIKRERPGLPDVIASGSPANPMGVAAMTLAGGNMPSTAPMPRTPSGASSPMAASGCTTRT